MKKTYKNISYVALQQFVMSVLPFLTIPYLARILGVKNNGYLAYSLSVSNIFLVIFSLGFLVYGMNEIAKSNKKEIEIMYIELQTVRFIFLILGAIIYFFICNSYSFPGGKLIYFAQGLLILSAIFDNSWYYQGNGDFKKVVSRNIIIKLIGNLSVFIFVKDSNDLLLYILIINVSQLLGNLILFFDNYRFFRRFKEMNIKRFKKHVWISFILFIPNFSSLLFSNFDRIILGATKDIVGLSNYFQSQRLITFLYSFLMIPSPVIIQKIAKFRGQEKNHEGDEIIKKGLNLYIVLSFWMYGFLVIFSKFIVNIMFGEEYTSASMILIILGPILITKTIGGVLGGWYLIPLGKNYTHSFPLLISTILCIILNLIFTPQYGVISAVYIFLFCEVLVLCIQIYISPTFLKFVERENIPLILINLFLIILIKFSIIKLAIGYEAFLLNMIFILSYISISVYFFIKIKKINFKKIFFMKR